MTYSPDRLEQVDAQFRAANYLGAAQLYLQSNVLLQEPLRPEHVKPRLPAHRAYICEHDQDLPKVTGWRWTDPAGVAGGSAGGE